jgi:hypothetical protein
MKRSLQAMDRSTTAQLSKPEGLCKERAAAANQEDFSDFIFIRFALNWLQNLDSVEETRININADETGFPLKSILLNKVSE